jgi:hypothetical protein
LKLLVKLEMTADEDNRAKSAGAAQGEGSGPGGSQLAAEGAVLERGEERVEPVGTSASIRRPR